MIYLQMSGRLGNQFLDMLQQGHYKLNIIQLKNSNQLPAKGQW